MLASSVWQLGDGARSRVHLEAAVAAAKRSESPVALARALSQQARLLMCLRRHEDAIRAGVEAVPLAEAAGLESVAVPR